MKALVAFPLISLLVALGACTVQTFGPDGRLLGSDDAPLAELAIRPNGLIWVWLESITSPVEIVVNERNPKTIKFVGVTGPDKTSRPLVYEQAVNYLHEHLNQPFTLLVRPQKGANLDGDIIHGTLMLESDQDQGYVDVTQAMLSLGLLKISDDREFQNVEIARVMHKRENDARAMKLGLWAKP